MPDPGKRTCLKVGLIVMLSALQLSGCTRKDAEARPAVTTPLKVAFVYPDAVSDHAGAYSHEAGRKAAQSYFGDRIATTFVEKVAGDADAEKVFRDLASQGNRLIYGTSADYTAALQHVARDFPEVKFAQANGTTILPNLGVYAAKRFESAYLAGLMAGKLTRSGKLGMVGVAAPEAVATVNAFTLGAQSVTPQISTRVTWLPVAANASQERDAARSLIDQGVDVLIQTTASPATLQAAQEKGVHAFGWDVDMSSVAPTAHLASAVLKWFPYYQKSIQSMLDGTWKASDDWWGVKENTVDLLNPNAAVSADIQDLVTEKRKALATGTARVFDSRQVDQSGRALLPAGDFASAAGIKGMRFYVRGVIGIMP